MSLIALIATSVSAYAVSRTSLASGADAARLIEELDAGHLRHPLIGRDQRDRSVAQRELGEHGERLRARRRADDLELGAVPLPQVPGDRLRNRGIVVDRQNRRLRHPRTFREIVRRDYANGFMGA